MADENISISVADKVAPSISTKLERIEGRARSAHTAITRLQTALNSLQPKGLAQLEAAVSKGQAALDRAALSAQRLATEQQRTAGAAAAAAAAQARLGGATAQAGTAQARLATATARTATEQQRGAAAAQRVATEQQRTATASAQAAAAGDRAALAALRLAQAQDKAGAASQRSAAGVMSFVRSAAALAGVGLTAGAILSAADAYTVMSNKLQNVSESQEQVVTLQNRLFEIANETRTSINEVTSAYARFDAALQLTGASQAESLRITETVSKALKVGGATAGEAASSLLQLSQAFNKGKLDGDEFRSLMENMPVFVKKAIAEAAKVPISGIFDAAKSGALTIDTLREAFEKLGPVVDEKFAKTIPTLNEAMTVFRNKFIQAWGEINKSLGITAALSGLIIGLANNLDILGVAVAAVGSAMILYFGPNLVAMFARAGTAIKAFTIAMAANPIGLIAVAISTAIVALAVFSDKIKLTADGAVTLKDAFMTVWAYIGDAAKVVAGIVESIWISVSMTLTGTFDGLGDKVAFVFGAIGAVAKAIANALIGSFVGTVVTIIAAWQNFPAAMEAIFVKIVNGGATAVEALVNVWVSGLQKIVSLADGIAPDMAATLNSALENAKIELPRMEGSQAAQNFGTEIKTIMQDAMSKDYLGDAAGAFGKRMREIAAERRKREAEAALRGGGPGQPTADGDGGKSAEKRARALQLVNKQLDDELNRMFLLKPEREIQQKFDQIESELLRKKITLNAQEASAIKDKLRAIEAAKYVQQEFDRIYEDAIAPARTRNAVQEAANKLLSMGAISQAQYNREIVKATEAYNESIDPLFKFNREIEQNIELLKLMPQQREVGQKLQQIENDLLTKGIILTQQETAALRAKLEVEKQLNDIAQIQNSLYSDSNAAKVQNFANTIAAIQGMMNTPSSGFGGTDAINALAQQLPDLFAGTPELLQAQTASFQTMYQQIDAMRQADLISEQTAQAMKFRVWNDTQNLQLNAASSFFGQLAGLQKSENSKMAKIGKAAAIAQALIQTYQGATAAYASMAPIPYVGPALGIAAAAAAVAAGLANVAQIRSQNTGFMSGGYTGNIPTTARAGDVHGQEYVFDAASTKRIGVNNLEAMRRGASQVSRNDSQAGAAAPNNAPVVVPAPIVNETLNVAVVSSREQALEVLRSSEGKQLVMDANEENIGTLQRLVGTK